MVARNFGQMLEKQWSLGKFVCVGLDSDLERVPESVRLYEMDRTDEPEQHIQVAPTLRAFNRSIVEATKDLACAYKPNIAFYEEHGQYGIKALRQTIADIHHMAPNIPVILDAKRADIGSTNKGYVRAAFDLLHADAITVHPYLGAEALAPLLSYKNKGIFVLCRTSNPGAGEFQDMPVATDWAPDGTMPLYQYVAMKVAKDWDENKNCGLVVGATCPDELREVRELVGDMPILIPGIGTQGGDVMETVLAGRDSRRRGIIINSSRSIIFASDKHDFADAARRETEKLHTLINEYRNQ